jgi:outer membrane protein
MKNLSLILNGVLFIAVGFLFYLHFSSGSGKSGSTDSPGIVQSVPAGDMPIVYINIDTLLNNYDFFADLQSQFSDRQAELEAQMSSRSRSYETNALDYQNKVQKGLVTRREAAELEQQLLQEQQSLLALRDELTMQLAEEEQVSNRKLIDNIMEYLKVYNQDKGYQFIFSNSFGDNVLFANESLDITYSVLGGINEQYRQEQSDK